jgi:hypothetical protein
MALIRPTDSTIRGPLDNARHNGNIVNPPRFSQLGGLTSGSAMGIGGNDLSVRPPGATQRPVPMTSKK